MSKRITVGIHRVQYIDITVEDDFNIEGDISQRLSDEQWNEVFDWNGDDVQSETYRMTAELTEGERA